MPEQIALDPTDLHAKGEDTNLKPSDSPETGTALDALAAAYAETGNTDVVESDADAVAAKAAADKIAADKIAADKLAAEAAADPAKAAADKIAADKVAADAAAAKVAADKKIADDLAAKNAPADPLDAVELPPHTKGKSSEAFQALKTLAKQNTAVLRTQLVEATTKLDAANAELEKTKSTSGILPQEVKAELDDLRQFRLAHDVQSDPTFKEFDTKLSSNIEQIYKKLEGPGMLTKADIEKIKSLGGPDGIDWEPVLAKLPIPTRRFIEAKLVENETLASNKEEALAAAKTNASGFLKERAGREVKVMTDTAQSFLKDLPWSAEKTIPANATAEQRAEIEKANEFARASVKRLQEYLSDRSPARFAEMAVGTLIAFKKAADLDATAAKLASVTTDLTAKLATVTADRDKLKADLDGIRRAESPRLRGDSDVVPASPAPKKGALDARSGEEAMAAYETELRKNDAG